jgi:hypothetical protein
MSVAYGRYEEAFKAIHSALSDLMAPPSGKKVTKLDFAWNPNGTLATLKTYDIDELLFTLIFSWNADGTLESVTRS